ncbi:hypothetical protein Ancab_036278 [Ancistrocladus abbreviatus]
MKFRNRDSGGEKHGSYRSKLLSSMTLNQPMLEGKDADFVDMEVESEEDDDECPTLKIIVDGECCVHWEKGCPHKQAMDNGLDETFVIFSVVRAVVPIPRSKVTKECGPWMGIRNPNFKRILKDLCYMHSLTTAIIVNLGLVHLEARPQKCINGGSRLFCFEAIWLARGNFKPFLKSRRQHHGDLFLALAALQDDLLYWNKEVRAEDVWAIGQALGASFEGDEQELLLRFEDMEARDRAAWETRKKEEEERVQGLAGTNLHP